MLTKIDTMLSQLLVEKKLINEGAMKVFIDEVTSTKESLFSHLLKKEVLSEEDLLKAVSSLMRIPLVDPSNYKPDPVTLEKVPLKIADYYKMAPLKLDKRKLTIAVSTPLDLRTQDDIRAHLGYEIEMVLSREKDITECLKKFYGFAAGTIGEMMEKTPTNSRNVVSEIEKVESIDNVEKMAGDASIAKLVNQIILEAYRKRATDIHIEPYRGKIKLRYRIDGILYNANVQAEMNRFISPVLSRIKIMSNLNIVERRLPQDGRAIVKVDDTTLDLRVSSIPTPYGESLVIRMLPMNRIFDLERLGLDSSQRKIFEELIEKPHGIIFITGPTGSGKSTTLYACLNKINTDERKIITIEDPVEYEMDGVTQIQVQSAIGLDFAKGLRSMLRHDPDVMMVGEVRDLETAEMAIRVALTGHLVFSTLHTNDAASGATRLVDIGIAPYLVASSVEAFIAQRLVRTICPHCKEEDPEFELEIKKRIAKEMGIKPSEFKVYRGVGCKECNSTGYLGRLAIYEILLVNETLKQLITRRATAGEIKKEAVRLGMKTLRLDGWQKVMLGLTTPSEIIEATQNDEVGDGIFDEEIEDGKLADSKPYLAAIKNYFQKKPLDNPYTDEERRIFMRVDSNRISVYYRLMDESSIEKNFSPDLAVDGKVSESKNISAGGIVFYANQAIKAQSVIEIKLELPQGSGSIECLARVVRFDKTENKSIFQIAVCFLDLTPADRKKLEKFVEEEAGG